MSSAFFESRGGGPFSRNLLQQALQMLYFAVYPVQPLSGNG